MPIDHKAPASEQKAERTAAAESSSAELHGEPLVEELLLALYAEDVRLGIVHAVDVVDARGALSVVGGLNYRRRAVAILCSLSCVSDPEIVRACEAEGADTPRGAAARAEARRRGLIVM